MYRQLKDKCLYDLTFLKQFLPSYFECYDIELKKDTLTANKNYIQNIFVTNKISFLQKYQGLIGAFRGSLFGRINTLNDMVEKLLNAIIKEIEKSETSNVFH